jgi:hypothetical protein
MKLQFIQIANRGVPGQERLHLSVETDTNLVYFLVLATQFNEGRTGVLTNIKRTFWFADKPVAAGDQVILYTGVGTASSQARPDGKMNHFVYWGLSTPIFAALLDCALIVEMSEWHAYG